MPMQLSTRGMQHHDAPVLLVVPAFREANRLPKYLRILAQGIENRFLNVRVLVVDDGSPQDEAEDLREEIKAIRMKHPSILEPIFMASNKGKGGAIIEGWKFGEKYKFLGFADADGAAGVEEVCRLVALLDQSSETALFASRMRMAGRRVERSFVRHLVGRCFAFFVGIMIDNSIYDTQCGLKFIPHSAYERIAPLLKGHRFAFDVELLAALRATKCPIQEIPIDWSHIPGSKVRFARDTWQMGWSVICIHRNMKQWM